jgi:hypothetical protein
VISAFIAPIRSATSVGSPICSHSSATAVVSRVAELEIYYFQKFWLQMKHILRNGTGIRTGLLVALERRVVAQCADIQGHAEGLVALRVDFAASVQDLTLAGFRTGLVPRIPAGISVH